MIKRVALLLALVVALLAGSGVTPVSAAAKQFCGARLVGGFALIGMTAKGVSCKEGWRLVKAVERRITSYDNYVYRVGDWTCLTSRDDLGMPDVKCSSRFNRVWWGHAP